MAEYKMVPLCSKCREEVPLNGNYIACSNCGKKFHYRCANLEKDVQQWPRKAQESFKWFCGNCEKLPHRPSIEDGKNASSEATISPLSSPPNTCWEGLPLACPSSKTPSQLPLNSMITGSTKKEVDTMVNIKRAKNVNNHQNMDLRNVSHLLLYNVYNKGNWDGGARGNQMDRSFSREEAPNTRPSDFIYCLKKRCEADNKTISMIVCDGEEVEYTIEHYFFDLQIEENDLLGLRSNETSVALDRMFRTESNVGEREKETILITADAGLGKTTLMKKLCYDWGTLIGEHYLHSFDLVINVPLKSIGSEPIKNYVRNKIQSNTGCMELSDPILEELRILYILDGFDEAADTEEVMSFLEERRQSFLSTSAKCTSTVIVTSRPYAVEKIRNVQRLFDRRLSISGFSTASQEKYIDKVLSKEKANGLKESVRTDPFLRTASESPLMLHLICCVYGRDHTQRISSRTELYLNIFKLKLEIYAGKRGENAIYRRIQETSITHDRLFVRLGKVAYGYLENKERITEVSLHQQFPEEFEFVMGLAVLESVRTLSNMKPITIYEFSHLTFAEFLCTIYVADDIRQYESIPGAKFSQVLKMGFFAGVIGEMILNIDCFLSWISVSNFTKSTLCEIRNEARLEGESWKSFCSHITCISSDCSRSERMFFLSTPLPQLREINISCPELSNQAFWRSVENFLRRFHSCIRLRIELPLDILQLSSSQTEDTFLLIDVDGTMSNLVHIANTMRRRNAESIICVQVLTKTIRLVSVTETDKKPVSFLDRLTCKRKLTEPIGLLPNVLPKSNRPYEQQFDCTWKIGNVEIRYHISGEEDDAATGFAIPIIVVSPVDYNIISKEPFLHERALKVVGFKGSAMSNATSDLKMPNMLGHIDCSTFLERLNKLREETIVSSYNKNQVVGDSSLPDIISNNTDSLAGSDSFAIIETSQITLPTHQIKDLVS